MARGHHPSTPETVALPKVEFEIILDEKSKQPSGSFSKQAISFGFNTHAYFTKPEHYIRHTDPLESDLSKTVEYDMDEQDEAWLNLVNAERKKNGFGTVSLEDFEIIMDRLEKEWFDLTKNIPKPEFAMPSEDSTCAICDDSEGENSNAIVFCDGCNLAVHQDCYGVPYIPEGQWLCRKCTVSPENPVSCYLCPNEGGAFKQTTHGEWVHLLCAIWIPETRVANEVFMEPVTGVERISKQRWKLRCSICEVREGACIQCTKPSCFVAFHATCARKEKLLMPMKSAHGSEPASLTCFCDKHLPPEQQEVRATALEGEEKQDRAGQNTSKAARAYAKTYKPGPPLVPAIIVKRILIYIKRLNIRKKQEFLQQMCRYWSLKREARRGAPLLKRLHLEPWTSTAATKVLTQEERLMRIDQLKRLRQDLINVRGLTDLCRKREIRKYRQMEVIYDVLAQTLFPSHQAIRDAFEVVQGLDKDDYFKNPVSKSDVPDYYEIIKHPMCWTIIDAKLDQHQYWNLDEFRHDLELVSDNALLYNQPKTDFYNTAKKTKEKTRAVLDSLESIRYHHDPSSWAHMPPELKQEGEENNSVPPIGDLESPVNVLELLMTSNPIREDLNMEMETDPVTSLLNYEFARVKPPPLHPPTPPPVPHARPRKTKAKRDRKAEAERAKANKEAREAAEAVGVAGYRSSASEFEKQEDQEKQAQERLRRSLAREEVKDLHAVLDASAGFRAPRTRNAKAIAAAFEAEAHSSSSASGPVLPLYPSEQETLSENSKAERLKKRSSIVSISQPSTPMLVDHVDNRDSFNMFNAGWILPPDQKRGGRVPTERQALPPPKKRQKTDHGGLRLSIVSTAPSEGHDPNSTNTAPSSSVPPESKYHPDHSVDIMDIDEQRGAGPSVHRNIEPSSISRAGSHLGDNEVDGPLNVVTQPNGVVIIEKLDTPAIRRERNMRRKAEKRRQAALGPDGTSISAGSSTISGIKPSADQPEEITSGNFSLRPPASMEDVEANSAKEIVRNGEDDDESELSELSDDSDASEFIDGEDAPPPTPPPPPVHVPPPPVFKGRKPRPRKAPRMEQYEDGTVDSYPWWPAVVHSDTNSEVPGNILQAHKEKRMKRKIKLFIVQYYDKQASWQSVPRDKLQLLGEDKNIDEEMLSSNAKQKWKTSASKQQCREAYEMALAAIDNDGNPAHHGRTRPGTSGDTSNAGK
ncbi:Peregrin [Psilocybe cubensis]|uniref:Peregrin n=1 Tax=Psilocybe cubensis TaxID=181762 RepID=A0ACB8GVN8_PSICU|nr:Peregrin [Psilocybe cubensis]KAH9479291.1 Peregrin [Psilocybe cubensis]